MHKKSKHLKCFKKNIDCPHFGVCSGCSINNDIEKIQIVDQAKKFFIEQGVLDFKVFIGQPRGWRCRAKLAVQGTADKPLIGLYKTGTHEVIEIPDCKVHHPLINLAIERIRDWMRIQGIEPYNESSGLGLLRYLQFAVDRQNQRVMLALVLNQTQEQNISGLGVEKLWSAFPNFWHSIWVNYNQRRDNVIFGTHWQKILGEELLWDIFENREVCFHPASFAQANPEMFGMLLAEMKKHVPCGTRLVEYYAGVGVIGLTLAEQCDFICCNEIAPHAKECFKEACERLPPQLAKKFSFVSGSAIDQTELIDNEIDIVIVDPPRKGLDFALLSKLCRSPSLKKLIYVSCGWKSFQRDCCKLLQNGWSLTKADSFLFFPGSEHLEVMAVFERRRHV